jgi:protein SCO1/2
VKRRIAIVLAVALPLVAAGIAAAIVLVGGESEREPFRGSSPPPGIALPAFELRDYTGEPIGSRELAGKVLLVTFLDTQCTESCPIIAAIIGRALDLLTPEERAEVAAIALSTDPDEDTRESVDAFLRRHRVEGELRYLVGAVPELRPVWNAFQIAASYDTGDDSLHSAPVRIYDRDGVWVATQHAGADLTPENLAHDLRVVLG